MLRIRREIPGCLFVGLVYAFKPESFANAASADIFSSTVHHPVMTQHLRGFSVKSPNWLDNPPQNPYPEVACRLPFS